MSVQPDKPRLTYGYQQILSIERNKQEIAINHDKDEEDSVLRLVRICPVSSDSSSSSSSSSSDHPSSSTHAQHRQQAKEWVDQAARCLLHQWPKGGPLESYQNKILHEYPASHKEQDYYGLPCSYLLISSEMGASCVGHGRLTECFESAGGNAAAATFIVISESARGSGLGSCLMQGLETEARRLGYHYLYLWTKTAIPFYQKLGYTECHKVVLKRACLKRLEANQVESLEAILLMKQQRQRGGTRRDETNIAKKKMTKKTTTIETVLLPPGDETDGDNGLPDVWLRKRLVEKVGSIHIAMDRRLEEIKERILEEATTNTKANSSRNQCWKYKLLSLPWQAQIGPSCGLAALRMVREYFLSNGSSHAESITTQLPSLLGEAQERNYTRDGEIFNARHLQDLAESVCGLDAQLQSTLSLQPRDVVKVLDTGGVWILPYDSDGQTKLPASLSGERAHYGVVVGIVFGSSYQQSKEQHTGDSPPKPFISLEAFDDNESKTLQDCDSSEIFVLVQHSLSDKLSIASWTDFMASNQQLCRFDQVRFGHQELDLKDRILLCRGMLEGTNFE